MNKIMKDIYKEALTEAAQKTTQAKKGEIKNIISPIWRDAIHKLLILKGCPCQKGYPEKCFLQLSPDSQKSSLAKSGLNFEEFYSIFRV